MPIATMSAAAGSSELQDAALPASLLSDRETPAPDQALSLQNASIKLQTDGEKHLHKDNLSRRSSRRKQKVQGSHGTEKGCSSDAPTPTAAKVSRRKHAAECSLAKKQKDLSCSVRKHCSAQSRLHDAQADLVRAKGAKETAVLVSMSGTIATSMMGLGIGTVFKGLVFREGANAMMNDAEERSQKAGRDLKARAADIVKHREAVRVAEKVLRGIQLEIADLAESTGVQEEVCPVKRTFSFRKLSFRRGGRNKAECSQQETSPAIQT